jgi:glutamine cyclotransferase
MIFHFYFYLEKKKKLLYNPPLAIVHVDKAQQFVLIECYIVTNLKISTRLHNSLQGFIEIANITRHLFTYVFDTKGFTKGLVYKKGKFLLTLSKLLKFELPNF